MGRMHRNIAGGMWWRIHLAHIFLSGLLYCIYVSPLYAHERYMPWQEIADEILLGIVFLGWIPVYYSCRVGASLRRFPYFLIMGLLLRRLPWRQCRPAWGTYWRHALIRWRWMLIFIKSYYLPMCVSSIYYGIVRFDAAMSLLSARHTMAVLLVTVEVFVMLISSIVATGGYSIENKKLGYPVKAVEMNIFGIFFCLICYPPLNEMLPGRFITGQFIERYRLFAGGSFMDNLSLWLVVLFMTIHVAAIVTQGLRFANLTYRGTVDRGMYAYIRHPQYLAKIIWFFFAWLPFFGSVRNIFCFVGWAAIYLGRTITEERFLKRFPDYRDYAGRVRWRFIPGVW